MNPIIKILVGALMVAVGVYSSVTFWAELTVMGKAAVGPLLLLVGAFIIWLESDEWKMRRHQEDDDSDYSESFTVEEEESNETGTEPQTETTQQDVKDAVEESESNECGECGREFDTQRGLSIHQSQKHD